MLAACVGALAVCLPGGPIAGQPLTGRQVADACRKATPGPECLPALRRSAALLEQAAGFCAPEGADAELFRKVFLEWAETEPEELQQPAEAALHAALLDAFPCEE
jgi:hypothetical protein